MPLEYVFDYPSPYAYLASTQLPRLGVEIAYTPIAVLDVMKAVNNQPSPACPAKLRYAVLDAQRWAKLYGVPLQLNRPYLDAIGSPDFDHRALARGALVAQESGVFAAYHDAIFSALWAAPEDLVSEHGRRAVLRARGIDDPDFWRRAAEREIRRRLEANNRGAVERGVFGIPTFFAGAEIFFGNDRLALAASRLATVAFEATG